MSEIKRWGPGLLKGGMAACPPRYGLKLMDWQLMVPGPHTGRDGATLVAWLLSPHENASAMASSSIGGPYYGEENDMALDFKRATDLFLATEQELAMALGISADDLIRYRENPRKAPPEIVARLGDVLIERGRGMARVGEILKE